MGAPKQKWTAEEEAALRAGVIKHGAGKWRTILKDPEFSGVLYSRSNVDLKDKWRNMSVMVHGFGAREKSRPGVKRAHHIPKQDDNVMAIVTVPQSDNDFADVKPLAVSTSPLQIAGTPQSAGTRRSSVRLDNLIIEAISSLKEPGGSNKTTIAAYIEEQYWPPQDFKKILSAKLKYLNSTGKLIKVNRKYRIAPAVTFSDKRRNSVILFSEEKQRISPKSDRIDFKSLSLVEMDLELARMRAQIDVELAKMRTMTPDEAAAFAAQAVQEAEAAVANAEEAAREAEEAEAEAAEAVAFLEAMKKGKTKSKMTI